MSDYKGIFAQEFFDESNFEEQTYLIKVVDRVTREVFWTGTVEATSKRGAQSQWRKEYSHIREQYDHSCGLSITQI